ncbi:MAG: hypothetical protein ACREOW_13880 [Thermodesulfobacteriota bacterium]
MNINSYGTVDRGNERRGKGKGRRLLTWSLVLSLGALGAWQFHSALFSSGFDLFPGDRGDARSFVYLAEHWYKVLLGHGDLLSPGMFYPVKGSLGYTDIFVAQALPYSLLRVAGFDMFSALAVPVILLNFLNYITCFILLNRVLHLNSIASCVGAIFFAFNSPKLNHPGHFNLQPALFLPLAVIFIIQFGRNAANLTQKKAFWLLSLAGLFLDLQLVTSLYQGWFFIFWSLMFLVLALSCPATRFFILGIIRRFWPALMGTPIVFFLGLIPLLLVYLPTIQAMGWRPYSLVSPLIPEFWSLLIMGDRNYIWGSVSAAIWRMHPLSSTEHNIGIGLVPSVAWLAIIIWSIWMVKKYAKGHKTLNKNRLEGTNSEMNYLFLSLAILATSLFYIIGMKYLNDSSPWRFVYLYLPGAKGFRTVTRYVMVLSLPMAIAFAFVVHRGMQKISIQKNAIIRMCLTAGMFAVIAFGLFEQLGRAPAFSKSAEIAWLNKLAARLPENCSSFYVVAGPVRRQVKYEYQIDAMLVSIMRQVPTLNGYSGHVPPGWSLREVEAPGYEENVKKWINRHKIEGHICRLEVGE